MWPCWSLHNGGIVEMDTLLPIIGVIWWEIWYLSNDLLGPQDMTMKYSDIRYNGLIRMISLSQNINYMWEYGHFSIYSLSSLKLHQRVGRNQSFSALFFIGILVTFMHLVVRKTPLSPYFLCDLIIAMTPWGQASGPRSLASNIQLFIGDYKFLRQYFACTES